ncbi:hypothetical protein DYI23_03430 [Roseibium polysiphoniae]|uniref:DUF333 domain-containing protein n=1 Tax=Roseibium polysiphoniae TaxID=2571221 RepID=A0A944CBU4_9HYPH|nr:hypothetical protein [Roseibium polysiphoniae]
MLPALAQIGHISSFKVLLAATFGSLSLMAGSGANAADCTCRYLGQDYQVGELICLKSPSGKRVAVCGMMLNNTSWKITDAPCPTAQLTPRPKTTEKKSS